MFRKNQSKIIESQSILDILKLVSYDSWVLLDLDNTVMEAMIELGSDQWFCKLVEHACQHMPENKKEAIEMVITIYHAVQRHTRAKAVEQEVVKLIKALQDIGIPVIALTARSECLINTTLWQLEEMGIDFSHNKPYGPHIALGLQTKDPATYHAGIIFCNGNDKGLCADAFLEKCSTQPGHALMVDDKEKHLKHVQAIFEKRGIPYDGIRYGLLDEKAKNVDMKEAHTQLSAIKDKLPKEAQQALEMLKIDLSNTSAEAEKYTAHMELDSARKSLKRKREEVIDVEAPSPRRSGSALSFYHERKAAAVAVQTNEAAASSSVRINR